MTAFSEEEKNTSAVLKHGIEFGVKDIELPTPRDYYHVNYVDEDTYYRLERFSMDFMRKEFSNRATYELPPLQGNWDNVRLWVENMWEAMYNPLWMRKYEPLNKRGWNYGIFDGHHRMRLFDALDANYIWGYVQNVKHFQAPSWVRKTKVLNKRKPRNGTNMGVCVHCSEHVKFRVENKPNHRLMGGRLVCSRCGKEVPYPWPGVL